MSEAEPLVDKEGGQAGDDVQQAGDEGVAQDVGHGGRQLGLLLARLLPGQK